MALIFWILKHNMRHVPIEDVNRGAKKMSNGKAVDATLMKVSSWNGQDHKFVNGYNYHSSTYQARFPWKLDHELD